MYNTDNLIKLTYLLEIGVMLMDYTELLENVIKNIEKHGYYEKDNKNILSILGKETDEVIMCKILWAILNLKVDGEKIVLYSFVKDVLKIDISQEQLEKAIVYREYLIPNNRKRIDLVIKMPGLFIPIEAKIYADDQKNQCIDYLLFSKERCRENEKTMLYYLTLNERIPTSKSISDKNPYIACIRKISWDDIYNCLCTFQLKDDLISQYCKALKNIVNKKAEVILNMSNEQLIDSPEGMKAAREIEKIFNKKKNKLMCDLFKEIVEAISADDKLEYDKIINEDGDYNYIERVDKYYKYKKSSWPGIMLKSKKIATLDDGTEYFLVTRFEIESHSYMFFGIAKGLGNDLLVEENHPSDELMKNVKDSVNIPEELNYSKNWLLYWEYITTESVEEDGTEPDFYDLNDAYMSLFDENSRNEYVKKVVEMFKRFQGFLR